MEIQQYAVIGVYQNAIKGDFDRVVLDEFDELETANEVKALIESLIGGDTSSIIEDTEEKEFKQHRQALQVLKEEFGLNFEHDGTINPPTKVMIWKTTGVEQ